MTEHFKVAFGYSQHTRRQYSEGMDMHMGGEGRGEAGEGGEENRGGMKDGGGLVAVNTKFVVTIFQLS